MTLNKALVTYRCLVRKGIKPNVSEFSHELSPSDYNEFKELTPFIDLKSINIANVVRLKV